MEQQAEEEEDDDDHGDNGLGFVVGHFIVRKMDNTLDNVDCPASCCCRCHC